MTSTESEATLAVSEGAPVAQPTVARPIAAKPIQAQSITAQLAKSLKLPAQSIERTIELLDAGNTLPFIARYRRDRTGGLDEEQIGAIREALAHIRQVEDRRSTILRSLESQGKLSDELKERINNAQSVRELDDLYLPYKPKKQTLASRAGSRGSTFWRTKSFAMMRRRRISTSGPPISLTPIKGSIARRSPSPAPAIFWRKSSAKILRRGKQRETSSGRPASSPVARSTRRTRRTMSTKTTSSSAKNFPPCRRTACWRSTAANGPRF